MAGRLDEFGLIAELFAPLSAGYGGAYSLTDDAAFITPEPGKVLVVTTDTMVEGVHFLPQTPADLVARKLVRVNLSDLAAKGAKPFAVLLNAAFSDRVDWDWATAFAAGLKQDFDEYGIALIGGDTVSTPGPVCLGMTAFGWGDPDRSPHRSGAGDGDDVWVSGTIGDGGAGLLAARGTITSEYLKSRYDLPTPRLDLGAAIAPLATAAMDVSDGLVQDLGHIARASGLAALIDVDAVPLSKAAVAAGFGALQAMVAGDDYELLFTAGADKAAALTDAARSSGVDITRIGRMMAGSGVRCLDGQGRDVTPAVRGWRHFGGV